MQTDREANPIGEKPDRPAPKVVYEIDGADFGTLEEFAAVMNRVVFRGYEWRGNLDAFNDLLRGGYGTPEDGFVLRWKNSDLSRQRLGYAETVRQLEKRLARCHPSNRERVVNDLDKASKGEGPTVFEWLVEIIEAHGPGGKEEVNGVELELR